MKKVITLLLLIITPSIKAQQIDFTNFKKDVMDEAIFSRMSEYAEKSGCFTLQNTSIGHQHIFRFIKKNHDKISFDELYAWINKKLIRKYDSRIVAKTDLIGNVGLMDCISCRDVITYQAIADRCLSDWLSTEDAIFLNWSRIGEAISFYDKKNSIVFILFAYFE